MKDTEEYRITCVVHDEKEVITHLGIGTEEKRQVKPVSTFVDWINSGKYKFYTLEGGAKAYVYVKVNPKTQKPFLTTNPDGLDPNNLDNLRGCYK